MMKIIPYDSRHEEVYNAFTTKTETKSKIAFFSAIPTESNCQEKF